MIQKKYFTKNAVSYVNKLSEKDGYFAHHARYLELWKPSKHGDGSGASDSREASVTSDQSSKK